MLTRQIAISIQRLYLDGRITSSQLKERLDKNTLTQEEYEYILNNSERGKKLGN